MEDRYEALIEQRAAMKGMVSKSKYKEVQEEIHDVSRALRESTNNLVRSLKENPNISGNLIKVQRDRTELNDILIRCTQEIRDRGRYQTITQKVDEENNSKIRLQQLKSREKGLREVVAKLQETLNDEQKAFQLTTTEQKQAILQLKEELLTVKGSTSTDAKFRRKESLATVSAIWREYKHKEHRLEVKRKDLEDRLQTESVVNNKTKEFLTSKHAELAERVAQWEAKYEQEMADIEHETAAVNSKREALLERLHALQDRRAKDTEREILEDTARKMKLQQEQQAKADLKRQNKAARRIVRELRSYIKRKKELEALKGDGKKKKGKDKKDKKKK